MRKYQIADMPPPLAPALVDKLRKVEVATIGHFRWRGFVSPDLTPVMPVTGTVVGSALTVAIPGADSTLLHHAVSVLRPGDFLVIDRLRDDRHACFGGGVGLAAKVAGAVGCLLDGPCTDPDEIRECGLPTWCRGSSGVTSRLLNNGGALNYPVSVGGVPVLAGDVVLADNSGVVVIPRDEVEEAADEALVREERGRQRRPQIAAGDKLGGLSGATKMVMDDQEQNNGR
jgi:regulator of RNase E activity RraA